jgi:hypothetical protein
MLCEKSTLMQYASGKVFYFNVSDARSGNLGVSVQLFINSLAITLTHASRFSSRTSNYHHRVQSVCVIGRDASAAERCFHWTGGSADLCACTFTARVIADQTHLRTAIDEHFSKTIAPSLLKLQIASISNHLILCIAQGEFNLVIMQTLILLEVFGVWQFLKEIVGLCIFLFVQRLIFS